jgi:hypothetical protein
MKAAFHILSMVAISVILLPSCNKTVEKLTVNEQLTGSWKWIRSDGGIGYNIHDTPASTGKEKTLFLHADYTYTITINNVLFSEGVFSIQSRKCIHDGQMKSFIQFDHDPGMMVESVNTTVLILSDEAYDGVDSEYNRDGINHPG